MNRAPLRAVNTEPAKRVEAGELEPTETPIVEAGRLERALATMQRREDAALARVRGRYEQRRADLLGQASPTARQLLEAAGVVGASDGQAKP